MAQAKREGEHNRQMVAVARDMDCDKRVDEQDLREKGRSG